MPVFDEKTVHILNKLGVTIIGGNEIVHAHYRIGGQKFHQHQMEIREILAHHKGMILGVDDHDDSIHRLEDVKKEICGADLIAYRWQNKDVSPFLLLDLDLVLNIGASRPIRPTGGYGLSWVKLKMLEGSKITAEQLAEILERNGIKIVRKGENRIDQPNKE